MLLILPPVWPSTRNVWAASATSASSNCQKPPSPTKTPADRQIAKALQKEADASLRLQCARARIASALCVEGKQISSEDLAALLAERAGSGAGDIAFVIGSSHGLDDRVKKAAQARISMGRITLPHQLARLVLTEQLYRACTIDAGMKYHK